MTTREMIRCKKCPYLKLDDRSIWICTEKEEEIHKIKDEECPLESEY